MLGLVLNALHLFLSVINVESLIKWFFWFVCSSVACHIRYCFDKWESCSTLKSCRQFTCQSYSSAENFVKVKLFVWNVWRFPWRCNVHYFFDLDDQGEVSSVHRSECVSEVGGYSLTGRIHLVPTIVFNHLKDMSSALLGVNIYE